MSVIDFNSCSFLFGVVNRFDFYLSLLKIEARQKCRGQFENIQARKYKDM